MTAEALIIRELLVVEAELQKLESTKAAAWAKFFAIADKVAGEGQSYRYLDPKLLQVLARIMPEPGRLLDEEGLLEDLIPAVRRLVTKQVIDRDRLDAALLMGKIPADLVERYTTLRASSPRRYGPKPATKEERAAA